jgi:hypothetical protein
LAEGVSRGPLTKAFPTKTIKRIDLERFRVAGLETPERLAEVLVQPEGKFPLHFEHFAEPGADGEESRALFSVLRTKLQRETQLVFRETGLRTLWLAFPILYVPNPGPDATEFLLAPLFLWPLRIEAARLGEGELDLVRDKEGGAPRFNRVAIAWIRRFLDFEPTEPPTGAIRDIETLADVETLCKQLGGSFRPALEVGLTGRIQAIPSRSQLASLPGPTLLNSGLVGLIQWENQELIRDLEALSRAEELDGAAGDFLRHPAPRPPAPPMSVPDELDRYLVTDADASQERAIWLARGNEGLVVHGPPGTGKSQVIVNIVADALAHGQTVLVVCQKKASAPRRRPSRMRTKRLRPGSEGFGRRC